MSRKKDDESPPVPVLSMDPPSAPVETLPGPQAPTESTEPEKRRRRRKKKEPEPTPTPDGVATPEDMARCEAALSATFEMLSKIAAKKRGSHWQLDKEESGTLGQAWTAALAPYLPKIGAAVPWAAAIAVTWSMVQPRLARDAELQAVEMPPSGPVLT